jgi:helicase associated protein
MPLQPKRWNAGFSALRKFKKREGHLLVPRHHIEAGFPLGQWVAVQRYWFRTGWLPANRKARLNSVGFIWSRREWLWERAFAALQKFKRREGHCRVPTKSHVDDGINLGYWVSVQRREKSKMRRDRKRRLDKIGFVWRAGSRG